MFVIFVFDIVLMCIEVVVDLFDGEVLVLVRMNGKIVIGENVFVLFFFVKFFFV